MSRAVIALDRFAAFLIGLVLIAIGAAAAFWWRGTFTNWPTRLDTATLHDLTAQPWWPWAAGLVGLLLILAGLRWLAGHLPSRGVSQLKLPGSTSTGKLLAQVRPVAQAAAEALQQTPGVRSASGSIQETRGQLIARLDATIEPQADLTLVAAAADTVSSDLVRVMQRDDLHCQVNLSVAHRARSMPRVG